MRDPPRWPSHHIARVAHLGKPGPGEQPRGQHSWRKNGEDPHSLRREPPPHPLQTPSRTRHKSPESPVHRKGARWASEEGCAGERPAPTPGTRPHRAAHPVPAAHTVECCRVFTGATSSPGFMPTSERRIRRCPGARRTPQSAPTRLTGRASRSSRSSAEARRSCPTDRPRPPRHARWTSGSALNRFLAGTRARCTGQVRRTVLLVPAGPPSLAGEILGAMTAWRDVERAEPESARRVPELFDGHRHKTIATCEPTGRRGSPGSRWPSRTASLPLARCRTRGRARIWAGIRGSHCTAPRSTRSRARKRSGRVRRRSPGGRSMPGRSPKDPSGDHFSADIAEVVPTRTSTRRPRCRSVELVDPCARAAQDRA